MTKLEKHSFELANTIILIFVFLVVLGIILFVRQTTDDNVITCDYDIEDFKKDLAEDIKYNKRSGSQGIRMLRVPCDTKRICFGNKTDFELPVTGQGNTYVIRENNIVAFETQNIITNKTICYEVNDDQIQINSFGNSESMVLR